MRRSVATAALAVCLLAAATAAAQPEPPISEGRPPEWGVEAGYGFTAHVNRGLSQEHVFLLEPGVGFRLSGRLEYLVEAHLARYFTPEGYMLGLMPVGGRVSIGHGRVLPYASIGAGFGWTDLTELDEIDRRFNFLLQASLGVRGALSGGHAWTLEVRWDHISNANTVRPNLGLNCIVFLAGWRF
jgi:opacity protein-like surface antigen